MDGLLATVLKSAAVGALIGAVAQWLVARIQARQKNHEVVLDAVLHGNKSLLDQLYRQIDELKKEIAQLKLEIQVYQNENAAMLRRIRDLEQERLDLMLGIVGEKESNSHE